MEDVAEDALHRVGARSGQQLTALQAMNQPKVWLLALGPSMVSSSSSPAGALASTLVMKTFRVGDSPVL